MKDVQPLEEVEEVDLEEEPIRTEIDRNELEQKLFSEESLDVLSPELWPAVNQHVSPETLPDHVLRTPPQLRKKLLEMVSESTETWMSDLAVMTRDQLTRHVRDLENVTYQMSQDH
eukprot:Ihof_evm17s5 gene=Ihof_evmTU17s5